MATELTTMELEQHRSRIRQLHLADDALALEALLPLVDADSSMAASLARELVAAVRQSRPDLVTALLGEYSLGSDEGVALMSLAEALPRTADAFTADKLIADKLGSGNWSAHIRPGQPLTLNAIARCMALGAGLVRIAAPQAGRKAVWWRALLRRAIRHGARRVVTAVGNHFVMGGEIHSALARANKSAGRDYWYSFDMLGEGARTAEDAECYFRRYLTAIETIGNGAAGRDAPSSPGISVKLSALHPRYEYRQRERVMAELVPRLLQLAEAASQRAIPLTVDAEEATRLDLSLDVIEAVAMALGPGAWSGFGLAVQAYQKRAVAVIDWCQALSLRCGRRLGVRLVKGAYWDTEIKRGQMFGLADYPVFTRKCATDLSYLACASRLLAYREQLYPQFATHNAATVAAILVMANQSGGYEFQRLHGMGDALYRYVMQRFAVPCRIYAPVGKHQDLLAYLVRRLLENGANSSFVNQLQDPEVPEEMLIANPLATLQSSGDWRNPAIPLPAELYGRERRNAAGLDWGDPLAVDELVSGAVAFWQRRAAVTDPGEIALNPANRAERIGNRSANQSAGEMADAVDLADRAFAAWSRRTVAERGAIIEHFAELLEQHCDELVMLCIKEAGKTFDDALAEIREAVDFCHYYPHQAAMLPQGESCQPLGVVLCISPWNFPLAIFVGQVIAALAVGNTVVAKPAEQTVQIAQLARALLLEAGVPEGAVGLVVAPGKQVGERVLPDVRIKGVLFTGSSATARSINRTLASRVDAPVPFIAETGGQNAMVVDSTALPEQVVDDVIRSGFHSAGQRCSALRVLFLQEEIAATVIAMLVGAMDQLRIGDPARLSTDVGPVIDGDALARLNEHVSRMAGQGSLLHECKLPDDTCRGYFFAPRLYEISRLSILAEEVFGPVVHIVRYRAEDIEQVVDQINGSGYGLTFGVHSRIGSTAQRLAHRVNAGNVYVNRDMIGAVVGVQPFGGRGLSGTGPKAGGPRYLHRLVRMTLIEADSQLDAAGIDDTQDHHPVRHLQGGLRPVELVHISQSVVATWSAEPVANRVATGRLLLNHLHQRGLLSAECCDSIDRLFDSVLTAMGQHQSLTGATGEDNRLWAESRGVALIVMRDREPKEHGLAGLLAALVTGNPVLALVTQDMAPLMEDCRSVLQSVDFGEHVFQVAIADRQADYEEFIRQPAIAAVFVSPQSHRRWAIARLAAGRHGVVLPVICDLAGDELAWRFMVEKTLTINTAAAGGDVDLLAAV